MTYPTKTRRRFTAQQKQETIDLCLQEGRADSKCVTGTLAAPVSMG
jgi:transposase-like protein